ncbi:hypothetical protein ACLQ3B_31540 [Micromonospora sp. DT53]|uniref:hypothetical protein n=1 Tax=Micromonospora sp. DT53 TaxID=3393444 RepID=UPI003CE69CAA
MSRAERAGPGWRRVTWRRRLTSAGVLLVLLAAALGVALWGKGPFDRRAYPSSRWDRSMGAIFEQFQVRVPDCALADLRYWSGDYIDDVLYLTFEADSACVDTFLGDNRLAGGRTVDRDIAFTFRGDEPADWGWYEDDVAAYLKFRSRPKPGTELTVEVTPDGDRRRVYLRGVEF